MTIKLFVPLVLNRISQEFIRSRTNAQPGKKYLQKKEIHLLTNILLKPYGSNPTSIEQYYDVEILKTSSFSRLNFHTITTHETLITVTLIS